MVFNDCVRTLLVNLVRERCGLSTWTVNQLLKISVCGSNSGLRHCWNMELSKFTIPTFVFIGFVHFRLRKCKHRQARKNAHKEMQTSTWKDAHQELIEICLLSDLPTSVSNPNVENKICKCKYVTMRCSILRTHKIFWILMFSMKLLLILSEKCLDADLYLIGN